MMFARRRFLLLVGLAITPAGLVRRASAQSYPSRPIRWVVPFPAGGTTDLIARLIAQHLTDRFGQPVVIDNKPGGGTNIAAQAVIGAPPDGYTLLFAVASNAINAALDKSLPFDFLRDVVPIAGVSELPLVLEVHPSVPATTLTDFIAHARANPGQINIASFGANTISHMAIELLRSATGIDLVHVPYRGGAPMMTDLLSGRVQAGVDALPNSLPHIQSGAARALAVFPLARSPVLPDVPTVAETLPGVEVSTWTGMAAPRGTPPDVIERLSSEVDAALADPAVAAHFAEVGAAPLRLTPAAFAARIDQDIGKWAKVIAAAGIKPE